MWQPHSCLPFRDSELSDCVLYEISGRKPAYMHYSSEVSVLICVFHPRCGLGVNICHISSKSSSKPWLIFVEKLSRFSEFNDICGGPTGRTPDERRVTKFCVEMVAVHQFNELTPSSVTSFIEGCLNIPSLPRSCL